MSSKVLVTGGAGFIGSHLVGQLLEEGHEVVVLDDLSTGRAKNLAPYLEDVRLSFVQGNILDVPALRAAMDGVDVVLHQAALPSVPRSIQDPVASNRVNVEGTLQVLVAARDGGARKVVMASSSSVYGDTPVLPKQEGMPPDPKSPYAVTKMVGEQYCKVFSEVYGLRTTCLRYFNVYGPRQDPGSAYAAVVPRFMAAALRGERPTLFGDGTQTRDFTFVGDVVRANLLAMEGDAPGAFNIAGGSRVSIGDLARMVLDLGGSDLAPVTTAPRAGDVRDSWADISLAREKLGYRPEYSLKKGLEVTMEWFSSMWRSGRRPLPTFESS